jgi:TonB family protein
VPAFSQPISLEARPALRWSLLAHALLLSVLAGLPIASPEPATAARPATPVFLVAPPSLPQARPPRPHVVRYRPPPNWSAPAMHSAKREPAALPPPRVEVPAPAPVAIPMPPPIPAAAPPASPVFAGIPITARPALRAALPVHTGSFAETPAASQPGPPPRDAARVGGFEAAGVKFGRDRGQGGRGTVTAAGSSFVPATLEQRRHQPNGAAIVGGFAGVGIETPAARPQPRPEKAHSAPVEILFKPRPAYTPEARRLKVEGEVLLEALFAASGRVQVLRVVRGLGHGLDENAVLAAHRIRFRPAEQDGRRIDSTATIHVTFQLAY